MLLKFYILCGIFLFLQACNDNQDQQDIIPKPGPEQIEDSDDFPHVSIVVPTYPPRHIYHELLYETFLAQDYPENKLELIIFDNGPKKSVFFGSQELKRVTYYHIEDKISLGQKRNWLVEHAKGSVILSFDDDDFYGHNYVSFMTKKILSNKKYNLIKLISWPMASLGPKSNLLEFDFVKPNFTNFGWGFNWVYKKDIFTKSNCRFGDENYAEEDSFAKCIANKLGDQTIYRFDTGDAPYNLLKFENKDRFISGRLKWDWLHASLITDPKKDYQEKDWLLIQKYIKIFNQQGKTNFFGHDLINVPKDCEKGPCSRQKLIDSYIKAETSLEAQKSNENILPKPDNAIRVAIYNVHSWEDLNKNNTKNKILENIKKLDADIIGLQEVKLYGNDIGEIEKYLGMKGHYCNAGVGLKNVIFSRFNFLNINTLDLTQDKEESRCAIMANLVTPLGTIDVSVEHLDVWDNTGNTRKYQINRLLDILDSRRKDILGQITMGDMNALNIKEISPFEISRIKASDKARNILDTPFFEIPIFFKRGFLDSFEMLNTAAPTSTTWAGRRIDYIFVEKSSKLTAKACYVYRSDASDHRMLICDFIKEN
jgi:endonuclease/exonuclease/phosphatase family metal-dependent hydrolase